MTEYCVEHAEAPQTDPSPGGDGYAQYVSCNSDECDGVLLPTGNVPRSPTCICWVWDDRMISQEPASRTLKACDPNDKEPWVGASQCNCSMGAKGTAAAYLEPTSPMANYVGRSKVLLPYYYYSKPMEQYVEQLCPPTHNHQFVIFLVFCFCFVFVFVFLVNPRTPDGLPPPCTLSNLAAFKLALLSNLC